MAKKRITISAIQLGDPKSLFPQSYTSVKRGEKARYVEFHKELNRASSRRRCKSSI